MTVTSCFTAVSTLSFFIFVGGPVFDAEISAYQSEAPEPRNGGMQDRPELSFDGISFERILSAAVAEPLFFDIEGGRFFTPPDSLIPDDVRRIPLAKWEFTETLKQWIRSHGIDLATQTDGKITTIVGFELRSGNAFPPETNSSEIVPAEVVKRVTHAGSGSQEWISLKRVFTNDPYYRILPFITREGGLGTFEVAITELRGPNAIRFRYQLNRGPDVPALTRQPIASISEPAVLNGIAGFLLVDLHGETLRLRLPGFPEQIELEGNRVIVRDSSRTLFHGRRLCNGTLDVDANADQVTIFGRGREAIVRRVDNQVQIALRSQQDNRTARANRLTLWMPQLEVPHADLKWTANKID